MSSFDDMIDEYEVAASVSQTDFSQLGIDDFANVEYDSDGAPYGMVMGVPVAINQPAPAPQIEAPTTPIEAGVPAEAEEAPDQSIFRKIGDVGFALDSTFSGLTSGVVKFVANTASGLGLVDQDKVDQFTKMMGEASDVATEGRPGAKVLGAAGSLTGQYVLPAVTGFKALRAVGASPVLASVVADSLTGYFGISPNDENIFNMISEDTTSPAAAAVRNLLATDPDSPDWQNRVANAVEALAFLGGSEALIRAVPAAVRKSKELLKTDQGQKIADLVGQITAAGGSAVRSVDQALDRGVDMMGGGNTLGMGVGPTGRARVGTTGQYIGAPPGVRSPQKLAALRTRVANLAREGAEGRMWYERSSRELLDAVGGDVDEADKLIQAIAVTSPGTPVKNNFDYALQAYSQWKAGEPIKTGRFPQAMSKKLEEIFNGDQWAGRKTDDFYNNLMIHIDPSRTGPVTGDIWMLRAFGFTKPNEMPSPRQYQFITEETQRIAQDFGWEPHQVQAAIWVTMKGRSENLAVKTATEASSEKKGWIKFEVNPRTGKKERVVIDQANHMKNWLKHAMKHDLTKEDIERAKFDYADALADNRGQISWESIPGRTSSHMPEIFKAPYEQQAEYHVAISKAFLDENGEDIIAKRLGLLSPGDFEAPGFFEGKVSPGSQTIAAMPRQYKGAATGDIEKSSQDLVAAYAAVRGILMKQDGVGWHRPFYKAKKRDENGIVLRIGRPFSEAETKRLGDILADLAGHGEYNPVAAEDGVRLLNFDFVRKVPDGKSGFKPAMDGTWIDEDKLLTNEEFRKLVYEAASKLELDDDLVVEPVNFHAYTGYSGNDWSVNQNGEDYYAAISGQGRSDLQGRVRDLINELQPRIDEIDRDFSGRYGWTINDAINDTYRGADDVTSLPSVN